MKNYYQIGKKWLGTAFFVISIGVAVLPVGFTTGSKEYANAASTTHHVCAVGCEFTTVADAFGMDGHATTVRAGDTVMIDKTYNPNTEKFVVAGGRQALEFPTDNVTLDCDGNTIGFPASNVFNLTTAFNNSVIQNCKVTNLDIYTAQGSHTVGFQVLNNIFDTNTRTSIGFGTWYIGTSTLDTYSDNFVIKGNQNINVVAPNSSNGGLISNNTFYSHVRGLVGLTSPITFAFTETDSNITMTDNIFYINGSVSDGGMTIGGKNFLFANNKLIFTAETENTIAVLVPGTQQLSTTIRNNIFDFSNVTNSVTAIAINPEYATTSLENNGGEQYLPDWVTSGEPIVSRVTVDHNTVIFGAQANKSTFLSVTDFPDANNNFIYVTSTNNLVYNKGFVSQSAIITGKQNATGAVVVREDYNGLYGFNSPVYDVGFLAPTDIRAGIHDIYTKPLFKQGANPTNDFSLVPFSQHLDVNGSDDIGAIPGVRRNTITINANAPVDYVTNDSADTLGMSDFVRSGDSITIAPGTYTSCIVSSTAPLQNIHIVGSGSATTINLVNPALFNSIDALTLSGLTFASGGQSTTGVSFNHVTNSSLSNLVFHSGVLESGTSDVSIANSNNITFANSSFDKVAASASSTPSFLVTNVNNSQFINLTTSGASAISSTLWMVPAVFTYNGVNYNSNGGHGANVPIIVYGAGANVSDLSANPVDVTSYLAAGTIDIHLALVSIPSQNMHITAFVTDETFHDPISLAVAFSEYGAQVDAWFPKVLSVINGKYVYTQPAGVTISAGFNAPSITKKFNTTDSIRVVDSNNNLFSGINAVNNSGGMIFRGTAGNNTVSSSLFTNTVFDIKTDSTNDNIVRNSTVDRNKIAILNTGKLIFIPDIITPNPSDTGPNIGPAYITKNMQIGTNDPEVLTLHALLEYLLYKPYQPRTTLYNVTSSLWVDQFKKHFHLLTNGKVDAVTRTALNQEIDNRAAIVAANQPYTFTKNLGPGWAGLEVLHLQMKLRDRGYYNGVMDGVLDISTQAALKQLQKDNKIFPDAIIRQTTMNVLNSR